MWRRILAVAVGLALGNTAQLGLQSLSPWRPPASLPIYGEDGGISEELRQYARELPAPAFLYLWITHVVGPMTAAVIATWIMARPFQMGSLIIGCVFVLGGMLNLLMLPHPVWFAVVDLLIFVPAAMFGGRLAERFLRAPAPESEETAPLPPASP